MNRVRATYVLVLALAPACASGDQDLGNPAPNFPPNVEAGPQLSQLGPRSAVISWHTLQPVVGSVECVDGTGLVTVHANGPATRSHVFVLDDLEPDTLYTYRFVQDGAAGAEEYTLRTAPERDDTPFSFAVVGDSGTGGAAQFAVIAALTPSDPDLVLLTGDNAYENGTRAEILSRFFIPFADLMARIPLYPALGNHDVNTDDGAPFLELLHLPSNGTALEERFYAFSWANGRFFCLDSNIEVDAGSVQHAWLVAELAASQAVWNVVYFHHPPYSSSANGSDLGLRAALTPVFDAYDVDLVLSGHDHNYERTVPIRGDQAVGDAGPDFPDPAGTIYVVTGGGGKRLYASGQSWFTARSMSVHHFVRVSIDGNELLLDAVDRDGVVFDAVTVTKTD